MLQDDTEKTDGEYHDTYQTVSSNCIRHFGYTFDQIDRLTLPEYEMLIKTHDLVEVDKANERHQLAWLGVSAGATRKDGKPVYKKYKDFFDYDAELKKMTKKPNDKFSKLSKHLKEKEQCNRK